MFHYEVNSEDMTKHYKVEKCITNKKLQTSVMKAVVCCLCMCVG